MTPTAHGGDDTGSGTITVLSAVGVVLALLVAGLVLASAVLASHRARAAADLAAITGATVLARGGGAPEACVAANETAERNGARPACRVVGQEVWVTAEVAPALDLAARLGPAVARARAGPEPVSGGRSGP